MNLITIILIIHIAVSLINDYFIMTSVLLLFIYIIDSVVV